jgi:ATP-dependent helicase/nuclease subunit B
VETLIADPYAFYARHVLGLRALDPLDADAGVLDYGNLVHAAMAGFIRRLSGQPWPGADAARAIWDEAAAATLAGEAPRPGLAAFWGPRLARIGGFVVEREAELRAGAAPLVSFVETRGELTLQRGGREVRLTAHADRIDVTPQGLRILDYKTGKPPTAPDVHEGRKPQLTLEAAIAARGGFAGLPAADAAELVYWQLSGGPTPGEVKGAATGIAAIAALADEAHERLGDLVADFLLGTRPFTARPHPKRQPAGTDYDHLSRLAEWAAAEEGGV